VIPLAHRGPRRPNGAPGGHDGVSQSICARGIRARIGCGGWGMGGAAHTEAPNPDAQPQRPWRRQLRRARGVWGPGAVAGAAWCRSLHALAMQETQPRVTSGASWLLAVLGSGVDSPRLHHDSGSPTHTCGVGFLRLHRYRIERGHMPRLKSANESDPGGLRHVDRCGCLAARPISE
jgi:hypothetical protein